MVKSVIRKERGKVFNCLRKRRFAYLLGVRTMFLFYQCEGYKKGPNI